MTAIVNLSTVCLLIVVFVGGNLGTVDLNIHEVQFLADHLSEHKCREVAEALHSHAFLLNHTMDGVHEPNTSCLELLIHWDRTEGRGKTFHDLTHRLRQLGEHEVADKLSKTVYHEKASALKRFFLDDPFKKMVPKESVFLETEKADEDAVDDKQETDEWTSVQLASAAMGTLSAILLLLLSIRLCCPSVPGSVWRLCCAPGVVKCCDSLCNKTSLCCRRFSSNCHKHLFGGDSLEEQDQPFLTV